MLDWIKSNGRGFSIAVVLHVIFIGALLFNWEWDKPKRIILEQGDVIQVNSIDANNYDAEIKKIAEKKRSDEMLKQQRKQQQINKKQHEKKRKEAAKKKKQDAARIKKEKLKQQQLKKKALKEKQLKDDAAKKDTLAKKQAVEKVKKEALAKKAADAKKTAEAKKKAEQDKKRQEAKHKQQVEAEKKRHAEIKRQQKRDREEWLRKSKGIVNKYAALISRKIEQNWRQPLDVASDLSCRVNIKLQSTGKVISVRVLESSGNLSFDRSVETAVRKASPLPVPEDRELFEQFRDLALSFEPGKN